METYKHDGKIPVGRSGFKFLPIAIFVIIVSGFTFAPPLPALELSAEVAKAEKPAKATKVQKPQSTSAPATDADKISNKPVSSIPVAPQGSNIANDLVFTGVAVDIVTEFDYDYGPPDLPDGTPQLRINESHLDGHLFPGTTFRASWDVTYRGDANGVILISATNPDELVCTDDLENLPILVGIGFYHAFDGTGFAHLSPMFLPRWSDIYFAACVVERISEDQVIWLGDMTNIVKVDYTEAPDLVVKDIYLKSDGEVEFIVANEGSWRKRVGLVRYQIILNRYDALGEINFTKYYYGDAALTTFSTIEPGEDAGWERAVGHVIPVYPARSVTVCINPGGTFTETNTENNCYTEFADSLLPDLALEEGSTLVLGKPPKEDDGFWLWKPFKIFWEGVSGGLIDGVEFDASSGVHSDKVTFTVTNTGEVTVAYFNFLVAVYTETDVAGSRYEGRATIEATIEPGQSKSFDWYFSANKTRYENPDTVAGTLMIDPAKTFTEVDESNNKLPITTVRRR